MTGWWQKISVEHPKWVVTSSVIVFLLLGWYGFGVFSKLSDNTSMYALDTEAAQAAGIIEEEFGAAPNSQIILFKGADASLGSADSVAFQAHIHELLAPLKDEASSIMTFTTTHSESFISHDKTMAFAAIDLPGEPKDIYRTLRDFSDTADQSKLTIMIGGQATLMEEMNQVVTKQLGTIELVSLPILLILLLLFFRSIVAAFMPIGIAIYTVIGAFAIARLLTHFVTIDTYAVNVVTILGLGLSIDYALLSVNRFREELPEGVDHAVKRMIATSGHTIAFSGVTVMACLLALLVFPFDIMHSIAIGGAAAVATAMVTTYVVLPSVLKLTGRHIDAGRIPGRTQTADKGPGIWHSIAVFTTTHPIVSLGFGFAVVGLAILPLLQFQPGNMDYKWLARGTESQQVLQTLSEDFPSSTAGLIAVLRLPDGTDAAERMELACIVTEKLANIDGVQSVRSGMPVSSELSCETIKFLEASARLPLELQMAQESYMRESALKFDTFLNEADRHSEEAVLQSVRSVTLPKGELFVTGPVAQFYDSNQAYYKAAPWAVGIIAVSMIILLALALRSFIIPVQAIIINSLGLAISLAAIVGIFQLGWFSELTGWPQVDGIVLSAPILVAAIAFGLAMDYSVFLYARMRETYDETGDSTEAIRQGIVKTGPIITAAAVALFVVVVGFLTSSVLFMQVIGLGMAIAVIVDAFFIRLILVPAIMQLMGKHSWR